MANLTSAKISYLSIDISFLATRTINLKIVMQQHFHLTHIPIIIDAIKQVKAVYIGEYFKVQTILVDRQFNPICNIVSSAIVTLNCISVK